MVCAEGITTSWPTRWMEPTKPFNRARQLPKIKAGRAVALGGNLLQLGNTFSDLRGGLSTVADRMPVLTPLPDGRYSVSLFLPVGAEIEYKYTMGDGFWNAEFTSD